MADTNYFKLYYFSLFIYIITLIIDYTVYSIYIYIYYNLYTWLFIFHKLQFSLQ